MDEAASPIPAERIVVDIGNSRIKWGLLGADDRLAVTWSTGFEHGDSREVWLRELECHAIAGRASWAIATVNPPVADVLGRLVATVADRAPVWYRSAADVPIRSKLVRPETAGADRALNAFAGRAMAAMASDGGPGLIISCGTALTVERIDHEGNWEGGAIAPGLDLAARSLHRGAAQIPLIAPHNRRPAWGQTTEDAVGGGVFWGTVGVARELITRQELPGWHIWTGGNAAEIAPEVELSGRSNWVWIVDDLVLRGLAMAGFGASARAIAP